MHDSNTVALSGVCKQGSTLCVLMSISIQRALSDLSKPASVPRTLLCQDSADITLQSALALVSGHSGGGAYVVVVVCQAILQLL